MASLSILHLGSDSRGLTGDRGALEFPVRGPLCWRRRGWGGLARRERWDESGDGTEEEGREEEDGGEGGVGVGVIQSM